jgi:hypothetical protein
MNSFMEYICRGVVRSEDSIRCLNKRTIRLAKYNKQLGTAVICLGIAGLGATVVLLAQDNEIKALRNQVDDLAKTMEEQNKQEGA